VEAPGKKEHDRNRRGCRPIMRTGRRWVEEGSKDALATMCFSRCRSGAMHDEYYRLLRRPGMCVHPGNQVLIYQG
jgi:hypothetical protein